MPSNAADAFFTDSVHHVGLQLKAREDAEHVRRGRELLEEERRRMAQRASIQDKVDRVAADEDQWRANQQDDGDGGGGPVRSRVFYGMSFEQHQPPVRPAVRLPYGGVREKIISPDPGVMERGGHSAGADIWQEEEGEEGPQRPKQPFSGNASVKMAPLSRVGGGQVWAAGGGGGGQYGASVRGFIVDEDGDQVWLDQGNKSAKKMVGTCPIHGCLHPINCWYHPIHG